MSHDSKPESQASIYLTSTDGAQRVCLSIPSNIPYTLDSGRNVLAFRFESTRELAASLGEKSHRLRYGESIAVVNLFSSESAKQEAISASRTASDGFDIGSYLYFATKMSRNAQTYLFSKRRPLVIQYYLGQHVRNETELVAGGKAVAAFVEALIINCQEV